MNNLNDLTNIVVREGFELKAIVREDGDHKNPDGWYHAIIYNTKKEEYVFCSYYNIKTGSWGNGDYRATYIGAITAMYNYLNSWMNFNIYE